MREKEKQASDQQIKVLNNQVVDLENQKLEDAKKHLAEVDAIQEEHKQQLSKKQEEIRLGRCCRLQAWNNEMLAKQQGGEVADSEISEEVNPFMVQKKDSGPPEMNELDMMAVSQQKKISDIGAPSTISRVDTKSGMLLLPFGVDRGINQGEVFTIWKDKKETARIRVQSSRKGYLLAYILPRFGEPQKLRPGDSSTSFLKNKNSNYLMKIFSHILNLLFILSLLILGGCFTASPDDDRTPTASRTLGV